MSDELRRATLAVHAGRGERAEGDPLNPPLVPAATFRARYARNEGTPGWEALEEAVGALEGGTAVAFASGMGAIAVVLEELPPGARIVVPHDGYTGTRALLGAREAAGKAEIVRVDIADTDAVLAACAGADLLWVETPSNPLVAIAELDALCEARTTPARSSPSTPRSRPRCSSARSSSAPTSWSTAPRSSSAATPTCCWGRRSRATRRWPSTCARAGGCSARRRARWRPISRYAGCARCRCGWSAARPARRARASACRRTPRSRGSATPGSRTTPATSASAADGRLRRVLSFEVAGGAAQADRVCERVEVLTNATSLGGVETLIERRARYPLELAPEGLLRVSVGLEDVEDLWRDLDGRSRLNQVAALQHRAVDAEPSPTQPIITSSATGGETSPSSNGLTPMTPLGGAERRAEPPDLGHQ